jgi:hypothetical protein
MNTDVWHKVCDYLRHLLTIRLAEKKDFRSRDRCSTTDDDERRRYGVIG